MPYQTPVSQQPRGSSMFAHRDKPDHLPMIRRLLIGSTSALLLIFFYLLTPGVSAHSSIASADSAADRTLSESASRQKVMKNRLLFPGGKVLVNLPKMLRAFTNEEYEQHYGHEVRPERAFIDDSTESRFTISVTKSTLLPSELEAYRIKMEKTLARSMKELIWFKREMLTFGATTWAHLEMQNQTTDGATVMSDFYVTSMGGHPLMFTVMTDTKYWYDIRKVMEKMMLSVMVEEKPAATAPRAATPETSAK